MSENLIGGVTSVVTADTTKFDASYKKVGETADATARIVAKAAKLQADGVAFSAKFEGDAVSEQSLRIITSLKLEGQARADYQKAMRLDKAGFGESADGANLAAAALQRLTLAKLATAEASKVQASADHAASVSQQQAASAFIRGAEGNVGIRAVERFAISIPGVGAALQAIFPIVGIAATAGIIVKMGADLYEMEQKGKHAGEEISRAFAEMNVKLAAGNDELELQTSKIEDEIAKLEKTPTDGLKTSLLEAAVAGDKLQESLAAVLKTERDVLKQQSVGTFESVLANVSPTGHAEKEIGDTGKGFEKSADKIRIDRRQALKEAGDDQDKQVAANKAYYDKMDALAADAARKMRARATDVAEAQKLEDEASATASKMGGAHRATDLTPRRAMYEGAAEQYDELQRRAQDAGENFFAEKKRNALVGAKENAGDQDKAAEALLKSMVDELHGMELQYNVSLKVEFDYWELRKSQFSTKSKEYNDIVAKQATLAEEGAKKAHEQILRITEQDAKRNAEQPPVHLLDGLDGWKRQDAKTAADRYDTANELYAERQKTLATLDATRVQEAAGRTMTQVAAATELAAIHTREYGAELERLEAKQAAIKNNPLLTNGEADQQKQVGELDKQIEKVKSSRQVQILQDNYSITAPSSSAMTGARDALDEFTDAAKDNAQIMRGLVLGSLHSFNEELLRTITGQKTDWKGLGRGVATNVASAGLNKAESSIFGALGFGKKDGSSEQAALWVRMAGIVGSSGSSSGLPGVVPFLDTLAGGGKTSGDSAGPNWGKLASTALSFLPGFADGGDLPRSSLVMVGEKGPEILNTGLAGGSVIPNHKVADMIGGGGDGGIHFHPGAIDARGSTDPAAVELAAHRAVMAAAPSIVAATHERSLRRSSLRR